jgi:hypothetical protein
LRLQPDLRTPDPADSVDSLVVMASPFVVRFARVGARGSATNVVLVVVRLDA